MQGASACRCNVRFCSLPNLAPQNQRPYGRLTLQLTGLFGSHLTPLHFGAAASSLTHTEQLYSFRMEGATAV